MLQGYQFNQPGNILQVVCLPELDACNKDGTNNGDRINDQGQSTFPSNSPYQQCLKDLIGEFKRYWREDRNLEVLPARIFFYRDGLSEGEITHV